MPRASAGRRRAARPRRPRPRRPRGPPAGFLQSRLAALLRARIAREEPTLLELAAQLRIDLRERPGDAVAHGAGLAGDSPTVDTNSNVDLALVAGRQERLAHEGLVLVAREVVLDGPLVDLKLAASGTQDDARDRSLPLARRLDARVRVQVHHGLAGRFRLLASFGGRLGLGAGALLGLGLGAGALLGSLLPLGLELDGFELRARRHVLGLCGLLALFGLLGRLGLRLAGGFLRDGLLLNLRLLGLRLLLLGVGSGLGLLRLRLLLLLVVATLVVGHYAWTSIGFGFCASCGCSGPA